MNRQKRRPFKPRARAFTLIELLVVIAIIAVLAAILFPVFASAREKARQTTCASNMNQLGLAIMQYVQDYDEVFPNATEASPAGDPVGAPLLMSSVLVIGPYVKSTQVFECPDDVWSPGDLTGNGLGALTGARTPHPNSYIPNAIQPDSDWSDDYAPEPGMGVNLPHGVFGVLDEYPYNLSNGMPAAPAATLGQINYPSSLIMLVDNGIGWANYWGANQAVGGAANNEEDPWYGDGVGAAVWWGILSTNQVEAGVTDLVSNPSYPELPGEQKHAAMTNYLFVDGHVKAWGPRQLYSDNNQANPQNWLSNAP